MQTNFKTPARDPLAIALDLHARPWMETPEDDRAADVRRWEAEADPLRDHIPQSARKHKVRGVLAALDQIEREQSNRRFTT
ncbi:MAG: hypothetical protein WCS43_13980 [Verrucomicrobiota bacterium]